MSNKSLPFILAEAIERLDSATSYEAYILRSHIKQLFSDRNTLKKRKKSLCCGMTMIFFNDETLSEDVIQINRIYPSKVVGIRQSDKCEVVVPIESLEFGKAPPPHYEDRMPINAPWDLPHFSRVIIRNNTRCKTTADGRFMLMGYLIKWNYNAITLKLLGGELITASCELFTPTDSDLTIFERYENSPLLKSHELERTRKLAKEKGERLDLDSDKDARKLVRLLVNRGCRQKNIEYCINEMRAAS